MTIREAIIAALTDAGLIFAPAAPVREQMQHIGTTRNRLTTVQLLGSADRLARIEALLGVPRDLPAVARFNGQLAAVLLRLALPAWDDGAAWFAGAAQRIAKRSPLTVYAEGATVTLEYRKKQGVLVLRIDYPKE